MAELGMPLGDGQAAAFMAYLAELKRWNRAYSLTGLREDGEIVVKHFLDSALYLKALDAWGLAPRSAADVGSGAGFPGIPMKLLRPEAEVFLLEPTGKKAAFLRHMARTLGLEGVQVLEKRVEEARGLAVEAAVTRALWGARDFVARAAHIVTAGGVFVLSKGPSARLEEETEGLAHETMEMAIPLSDIKRRMVVIRNGREKERRRG
ncbi:MAG: hypothetical protein Kow0025_09730 [Thermodesulfovibrionales bacterium]